MERIGKLADLRSRYSPTAERRDMITNSRGLSVVVT
jgi:hypothetical protein